MEVSGMNQVTIEYFGHSCFRLTGLGQRVVLDPFADGSVPGLGPLRTEAEFVFCSHGHGDHSATDCVTLLPHGAPAFTVTEVPSDHDHHGGSRRGKNMIRVFDFGGLRIAHFGDLGRPLTAEEVKLLSGLDLALVPVGGHYTIDAAEAAALVRAISPRAAVLMHYRTDSSGSDVIAHIRDVKAVFGPVETMGAALTLTADAPAGTIIMTPNVR